MAEIRRERMDLATRKRLYQRCDPSEPLSPDDERNVDIDGTDARGERWAEGLQQRIELTDTPVFELFTGLPGSGKSTELLRLAALMSNPSGSDLHPVLVDATRYLDLNSPVDVPDVQLMLIDATERDVLRAEGLDPDDPSDAVTLVRLWDWLVQVDPLLRHAELANARNFALELRTQPAVRDRVRGAAAMSPTKFRGFVRVALTEMNKRVQRLGRAGLLLEVDSLEKLQGTSSNWSEVLESGRRLFWGHDLRAALPVHAVFTIPPALLGQLHWTSIRFLPMIKLRDRFERENAPGSATARAIVERRIAPLMLQDLLGAERWDERLRALVRLSAGSPRAIVQLVRAVIAEADQTLDDAGFRRILRRYADAFRWAVPDYALNWLRRVEAEKRLILDDESQRPLIDQMLASGVILRYLDDGEWYDVHPAVADMLHERDTLSVAANEPSATVPRSPEPHAAARIVLKNMGPFDSLDLDLRPGWNVLVGNNGCGKTSVIRTLALALAGNDPGAAVAAQELLRAGADDGLVRVVTDHDEYITSLSRVRGAVRTIGASETLPQQGRWLALGFPALRGLTTRVISGPTVIAPPVPGAHDLLPLVEGAADARLDDTRQWIVNTALRAEGNEGESIRARHQQLLDRWFNILRELMPGLDFKYERVDRDSWQVLVRTPDGIIPLDQLSQGMVSTMGWIGTLLRRLYEAFPESKEPEHEPALVLIDEIDAHLHPSWQRRIVPLVRSHFPRVQVVATSHSPLVVANLEPDEIVVFSRDEEGHITWHRVKESLRGYRTDQVLTSDAFGLDTTLTEYATKLLQDYSEALSAKTPNLDELTRRVREEIPSPPETVEERRALDAAMRETDEAVRGHLAANPGDIERIEAFLRSRRPGDEPS